MDIAVLAQNIRSRRDALDLTQDEVADAADMQTAVYSRIERGEVDPRVSTVARIATALQMTASELLEGVG